MLDLILYDKCIISQKADVIKEITLTYEKKISEERSSNIEYNNLDSSVSKKTIDVNETKSSFKMGSKFGGAVISESKNEEKEKLEKGNKFPLNEFRDIEY